MNSLQLKLCDIQGRLFVCSLKKGMDSLSFASAFMRSKVAKYLDSEYHFYQWAGEEYLLEELCEEAGSSIRKTGKFIPEDAMYWMGYLYRYWQLHTGETSAQIYKQAPASVVAQNYLMFHTMDCRMAIEDLKEIYLQKKSKYVTK